MNLQPANMFHQVSLGLSITQAAIRGVSIDAKQGIKQTAEIRLEPGAFSQGAINKDLMRQGLQQLLAQQNFASEYTAVTIPEYYSFTRSHALPKMPLEDVSEAISWQLENILPLPKESVYFDWKLISKTETQLQVLIIAMPRETLDTLIQVFESVGLRAVSFEPSASALGRVMDLPENQPAIVVEINPHGSSATLIENKVSYLTITNQFDSTDESQVRSALDKTSQSIMSLVQYCVNQKNNPEQEIQLLLTGESASQEVAQWIQSLTQRQVSLLEMSNVPAHFHQAYAAATVNMLPEDRAVSVNLLPDILREYYNTSRLFQKLLNNIKLIVAFGLISIVLSGVGLFMAFMRTQQSDSELVQIEAANAGYQYNSQDIVQINQSSQLIVSLFGQKNTPVNQMQELLASSSDDIQLTNMVYARQKDTIEISGVANDRANLLEFVNRLRANPDFNQVNIPIEALEKPSDISFNLSIGITQ
jgi:Tfp pilus assembly PilM family ATPase